MTGKVHEQAPPPKKRSWKDGAPPTPLQLPGAICPECGEPMVVVPLRGKGGRIDQGKVRMFCDVCEYGYEGQLVYFNGMNVRYQGPKDRG
jgi:hypothetical protein